ncbi:MAG: LPP20 family lipoprotein [Treponema sp.]|nr:LPP20 family lipoprotein [Treponema sp.]
MPEVICRNNFAKASAVFCILLAACAGTGAASKNNSDAEAENAARSALAAMDGGGTTAPAANAPQEAGAQGSSQGAAAKGTGSSSAAGSGAQAPAQSSSVSAQKTPQPKPAWVDTPDAVFSKQQYISAVGYGFDRNQAEHDALARLTGVFGQSVQAELKTISSYSEAVKSGAIQVAENSSVQNAITTSAAMDSLVGAEIAGLWYDNKSTYYAAAVMEKAKTSALYADLIHSNQRIVDGLVNMDAETKNSLDGYSRYLLAGTIADANRIYANVLTIVGDTRGINPGEMKKGDDYRLEAAAIARNIPIGVTVTGDRGDRIRSAFAKALSGAGFRSGGNNSRYMLNAAYTMTPVELPGQTNKFVRYQLNGLLVDTAEGSSVLVSYDASGREGHITVPEAEERTLRAAENKIAGEFETVLKEYLSTLIRKGK